MTDSIVPNLMTVTPAGGVSQTFPGGVQIPLNDTLTPEPFEKVSWQRQSDGAVLAFIQGARDEANGYTQLQLWVPGVDSTPPGPGSKRAGLTLETDKTEGKVTASASNGVAVKSALLIDGLGQSSFVQRATGTGETKLSTGTVTVSTGASRYANASVPHALGKLPQIVIVAAQQNVEFTTSADSFTTTNFTAWAYSVNGLTSYTTTLQWLAIG